MARLPLARFSLRLTKMQNFERPQRLITKDSFLCVRSTKVPKGKPPFLPSTFTSSGLILHGCGGGDEFEYSTFKRDNIRARAGCFQRPTRLGRVGAISIQRTKEVRISMRELGLYIGGPRQAAPWAAADGERLSER